MVFLADDYREDELTLGNYLQIISKRKWVIIQVVLITILITAVGSLFITPIYEASSTLHIKEQKSITDSIDPFGGGLSSLASKEEIATQIEILKSRTALESVVKNHSLHLEFRQRIPNVNTTGSKNHLSKRLFRQQV